ncbi:MAG: hypothetical protein AAGD28_00110 [Bacteroidota bacterium]
MKPFIFLAFLLGGMLCMPQEIQAQKLKFNGWVKTSTDIDSVKTPLSPETKNFQKDLLAKFNTKNGRISLNLQLDLLRLSQFRPIPAEGLNPEIPSTLTQKRSQFQMRLGLVFFLWKGKKKKSS